MRRRRSEYLRDAILTIEMHYRPRKNKRLAPRGGMLERNGRASRSEQVQPFFRDEALAKTKARMVVARRSGSGTSLVGLAQT